MLKGFLILMDSCRDADHRTLRWTVEVIRRISDLILFNWELKRRSAGAMCSNGESSSAP